MRPSARAIPTCLQNSGETPLAPFKTGGGLDLMIGADPRADDARQNPVQGDLRLLVTLVQGKPRGLIYRPVVPGTKEPVPFSSPWRTITIDRVDDVSDAVAVRGRRGQLRVLDPAGRPGSEARGRPGDSSRLGRSSAATGSRLCSGSIGATRPPASPATCPARPCWPRVSGAGGFSFRRDVHRNHPLSHGLPSQSVFPMQYTFFMPTRNRRPCATAGEGWLASPRSLTARMRNSGPDWTT